MNQEIHLWDLLTGRLARKYTGQRQGQHIIRSCFGGVDGNFVVSGSEGTRSSCSSFSIHAHNCSPHVINASQDGNVYVWHRDRAILLDVLTGHGNGSVNSVAWNPRNTQMFASCSDDCTIRLWEPSACGPDAESSRPTHRTADNRHESEHNGKGKGKSRESWVEDDSAS
jgi:WD repeat-containing protein 26